MNATAEQTFEDVDISVPESNGDYETIPAGVYSARLVTFTTVDKPDWKIKGEEGEDRQQWEWGFVIMGGDYDGTTLKAWSNRSWHPKSTAHKWAAALLGVPELPVGSGMSTKQLANKACQLWVVEIEKKNGDLMNKVEKVLPTPKPRQRQQAQERPTVPQRTVTLPPEEGIGDDPLWPGN